MARALGPVVEQMEPRLLLAGNAPDAPGAPDLIAAADSGTDAADNLTNYDNRIGRELSFDVPGVTIGNSVFVSVDGVVRGTTVATDTTARVTLDSGFPLSEGEHAIAAHQSDGNISASSASLVVAIDISGPGTPTVAMQAASDSGVSSSDRITNIKTPSFDLGNITDKYSVYLNGGLKLTGDSTQTVWTSDPMWANTHTLRVTAFDDAGNAALAEATLSFTIMLYAPSSPQFYMESTSDTGTYSYDEVTADNTPTYRTNAGPYYRFYIDQVLVSGEYQTGAAFTPPPVADGVHEFAIRTVDQAGNQSVARSETVTIDTYEPKPAAPQLMAASDTGVSATDGITKLTTLTFVKPASAYTGQLNRSGTSTGTGLSLSAQPEGTWLYTMVARDLAGNLSPESDPSEITIDLTAPAKPDSPVLLPESDTGFSQTDGTTSDNTPTFSTNAGPYYRVRGYGSNQYGGDYETAPQFTLPTLADGGGFYFFSVEAVDAAGNVSPRSTSVELWIDTVAPGPVTLYLGRGTDTGANNNDGITDMASPTLAVTGGDSIIGYFEVYQDGELISTPYTPIVHGYPSFTFSQEDYQSTTPTGAWLAAPTLDLSMFTGQKIQLAFAYDTFDGTRGGGDWLVDDIQVKSGQTLLWSETFESGTGGFTTPTGYGPNQWTRSTMYGALPGHSSSYSYRYLYSATSTYVERRAGALISPQFKCPPNATLNFNHLLEAGVSPAQLYVSVILQEGFELGPLADGTYTYTAIPKDLAGNVGALTSPFVVTVDTPGPAAPTMPMDLLDADDTGLSNQDNITSRTSVTLAVPASGPYRVYIDGVQSGGTISSPTHVLTLPANGSTVVTFRHVDALGNVSDPSPALTLVTDTLSPSDLSLGSTAVAENQPAGALVGALAGTDADIALTYSLVAGAGDAGNAWFSLAGNQLRASTSFDYETAGSHSIRVLVSDRAGNSYAQALTISVTNIREAAVSGRSIFYNRSYFDGNDAAANVGDDSAIATDKAPLMPGETATFANYTSYSRGLNGIMLDLTGFTGTLALSDFQFAVGNSLVPANWIAAPAPTSISQRPIAAGTRVTLIWADNAIQKQWLQVRLKASDASDLASDDVFYFGNAVGETGNSTVNAQVNAADELATRNNKSGLGLVAITSVYDFNRDGRVNSSDELIARNNKSGLTPLILLGAPTEAEPAAVLSSSVGLRMRRRAPDLLLLQRDYRSVLET